MSNVAPTAFTQMFHSEASPECKHGASAAVAETRGVSDASVILLALQKTVLYSGSCPSGPISQLHLSAAA